MKNLDLFKSGVVLNCLLAGQNFVVSREKRVCFESTAPSEEQKLETAGNSKITGVQDKSLQMPVFIKDQSADQYRATINNEWAQTQSFYLDAKADLEKEVGKLKKTDKADDTTETKDKNKALNDRLDALKDKKLDELKSKLVALGQARAENALKFRDSLTKKMLDYRKAQVDAKKANYEKQLTVKDEAAEAKDKPEVKPLEFKLGTSPDTVERVVPVDESNEKALSVMSNIGFAIYVNQGEQEAQAFLNKLEAEAKKKNEYTTEALNAALGKPVEKYLEGFRNHTINLPAAQLGTLIGNLQTAEKMFENQPKLLTRYKNYLQALIPQNAAELADLTFAPQGPREWALHNAEAELKDLEINDEELDSLILERVKEKCSVVKDAAARKDAEQKIFAHLVAWRDGLKAKSGTVDPGGVDGEIDFYIGHSFGYESQGQWDNSMDFQNYKVEKGPGNKDYEKDNWKRNWAVDCVDKFLAGKASFSHEASKAAFRNAMISALQSYETTGWYRDQTDQELKFGGWGGTDPRKNDGWDKFLKNKWAEWKMEDNEKDQTGVINGKTNEKFNALGVDKGTLDKFKDKDISVLQHRMAGFLLGAEKNFEDKGELGKKALADYKKYLQTETQKVLAGLDPATIPTGETAWSLKTKSILSAEEWWNSVMVPKIAGDKMKALEAPVKKEGDKDEKKEKSDDKDKKDKPEEKGKETLPEADKKVKADALKHLKGQYEGKKASEKGLDDSKLSVKNVPVAEAGLTIPADTKLKSGELLAVVKGAEGKGAYKMTYLSNTQLTIAYDPEATVVEEKKDDDKSKDKGKVEGGNANAKNWLDTYSYSSADFKERLPGRPGKYMHSNKPNIDVSKERAGSILASKDMGADGTLQLVVQKNGSDKNVLNVLLVPPSDKAAKKEEKAPQAPGGVAGGGVPPEVGEAKKVIKKKKPDTSDKGDGAGASASESKAKKGDVEKVPEAVSDKQQEVARQTHEFVAGGAQGTKKPEEVVKDLAAYLNSKNLLNATDSFTYSGVSYGDHLLIVQAKNGKFSVRLGAEVKRPLWKDEVAPTSEPDPQEKERKISEARNKITSALQPKFDSLAKEISASVNKKESTYFQSGNFVKEAIQSKIQSDLQSLTGGLSQEIAMVKDEGGFRLNGMTLEYKVDDKNTKTASLNYLCLPGSTTPGAAVVLGTRTVG